MAICSKCGKTVAILGRNCPYCNNPLSMGNVIDNNIKTMKKDVDYDSKNNNILLMSIFIPFGLYYYWKNKDEYPLRASSALGGVLIGTIATMVLIIFILFILIIT